MRLSDPQLPIAFMPAVLPTCTRESRRGCLLLRLSVSLSSLLPSQAWRFCGPITYTVDSTAQWVRKFFGDFYRQIHVDIQSILRREAALCFGRLRNGGTESATLQADGCRLCYYFADDKTTSKLGRFIASLWTTPGINITS
ncbi:hypothetical protein ECG_07158 [Echinococcus granulosus]|uniref:Secreted protein n=1 Tax=Echinococcus granulosus TaxID=6210 RepID=A0A068WWP4_ECHGR|nr:hypothetical protein ECG_07158 [Echinococcus granulosus]CDS22874.1 hypothetical protein EgrG_000686200 [Echinococcus granulosus]